MRLFFRRAAPVATVAAVGIVGAVPTFAASSTITDAVTTFAGSIVDQVVQGAIVVLPIVAGLIGLVMLLRWVLSLLRRAR